MSNDQNHNDPLERLFRKKAEEYNISYREEDWLNLEKKLDARDMKLYYRRRLRWLAAASFLILSLIGYYTVQNHNKIAQLTEQLNQGEVIQEEAPSVNSQEDIPVLENGSSDQTDVETGNSGSVNVAENGSTGQEAEKKAPVSNDTESIVAASDESTQSEELSRREFVEATQMIRKRPVEPSQLFPDRSSMLASAGSFNQPVELRKQDSFVRYQPNNGDSENGSSAMLTAPLSAQSGYDMNTNTYPAGSRLALGIVISPDLSTVGAVSNFYDPGFKGGLLAEYSLSKNISLISGVTVSNVKYKAVGGSYNPPQAWNYGTMPNETTAVCLILDIPLNLKANLFNFDRSRVFATAGLSSYVMLNEDYQFSYEDDSPGLQSSWSDRTGTRHWFSNAGFSVGIEYDLSPTWSIRAEPHIKVPLKGVGWGDVELYSMGSFVSLNYRFGSP